MRHQYPALLSAAREMSASLADEDEFDYGLDRLLDGITASAADRQKLAKRP